MKLGESSPLDIQKLKKSLWDDQDMFIEIAHAMRQDIATRGGRLSQAYLERDALVAKHEAHALRGGLASVTAIGAAGLAADLEKMALTAQWEEFHGKLEIFELEIHRIDMQLEQELKNLV